jgi:hypothetical protein
MPSSARCATGILGARAVEESKKALEPVSVLTIGVGLVAAGFLKKLGEDAYVALKEKLKAVFSKANSQPQCGALLRASGVWRRGPQQMHRFGLCGAERIQRPRVGMRCHESREHFDRQAAL